MALFIDINIADAFAETKHPRARGGEKGGQFVKKGSGGVGSAKQGAKTAKPTTKPEKTRHSTPVSRPGAVGALKPSPAPAKAAPPSTTGPAPQPAVRLTPAKQRAFAGKQVDTKAHLSKQEAGRLGEAIVMQHLRAAGMQDAKPLNMKASNFPIDMMGDHTVVEVKTGLVSNQAGAQHWRATIGQPGKAETEWLRTASPEDKRAWNEKKMVAILQRKQDALNELEREAGHKLRPLTVTTIVNPDTKTVDVFQFDGFHLHLRWNNEQTQKAFIGSYKYA